MTQMVKRKTRKYYGSILRTGGDRPEREIIKGCVPGKRKKDQARKRQYKEKEDYSGFHINKVVGLTTDSAK